MDGKVNIRNMSVGNPPAYERNVSREKVDVWAGICGNGVLIGPFVLSWVIYTELAATNS